MTPNAYKQTQKRHGKTRRLNQLVAKMLAPALRARGITLHRIITEWNTIAQDAAAWAQPHSIHFPHQHQDNGTLTVATLSGRGPEMQMLAPQIISRCNQIFGYNAISRIAIRQTATPQTTTPQATTQKHPPHPNTIKPHPKKACSPKDRSALENARKNINPKASPELRDALDRLGKSLLGENQPENKKLK